MEGWSAILGAILVTAAAAPLIGAGTFGSVEAASSQTHHVHIENFDMDPAELTIEAGDTVEWHNHDDASHTATDDGGSWDTGALSTGETETITFDEVGDYTYHCEFHSSSMNGFELHVVEPNADPTVAITTPTEDELLSDVVDVQGTASDPDGTIEHVEVRVDGGAWQNASGTTDWSFSWDTRQVVDGTHAIEARSFDGDQHSPIATVNVTTDNPTPDLSVEAVETQQSPGEATVDVTVANVGETPAPSTSLKVRYQAERAQGLVGSEEVPALDASEETLLTLTWETLDKVGEFELVARVDPGDAVTDPVPDNDERTTTICVPDAEGLTCNVDGTEVPDGN